MNRDPKESKPKDPLERAVYDLVESLADLIDNADSHHWSREDTLLLRKRFNNLMRAKP